MEPETLLDWSCSEFSETFILLAAAPAFAEQHDMNHERWQACPLPAGIVFLVSGEVQHFVHLIHWNLHSCLSPRALTWLPSRLGLTHDPLGLNWIPSIIILLFRFRHQLVPHLVPNSSPVPLGNAMWGSGVCSVLVRSVSPCRLVLEVRLFPSPPCAVSALARRLCPLFSSSCLSGFSRFRIDVKPILFLFFPSSSSRGHGSCFPSLPTKLWDSAGRECGRTFLYLVHLFSYGEGLSQEPRQLTIWDNLGFYTVVAIWDLLRRRFQPYLHGIFTVMAKG